MVIGQGSLETFRAVRRNLGIATRSRERLPITCSSAVACGRTGHPASFAMARDIPDCGQLTGACHDRLHSSLLAVVRARGCRGAHRAVRRLRAFASLPLDRLRLEARPDRDRRRGAGRRGRGPDRPRRRQHGHCHHRRPRPHHRYRAAARRYQHRAGQAGHDGPCPRHALGRGRHQSRCAERRARDGIGFRQELALLARRRDRCADRARCSPASEPGRRPCARCIRRGLRHGRARDRGACW